MKTVKQQMQQCECNITGGVGVCHWHSVTQQVGVGVGHWHSVTQQVGVGVCHWHSVTQQVG